MKITGKDVKGVLKVLIILILVAGVVAGTCYLFFRYLKQKEDSYGKVTEYVYSVERDEFVAKIGSLNKSVYDKASESTRFTGLMESYNSLETITSTMAAYLMTTNVDNAKVVNSLNHVIELEEKCNEAMDEFFEKAEDKNFNRSTGSNDAFEYIANYLVAYSQFIQTVNTEINKSLEYKDADIKFSVVDIYLNVVINTYSNLDKKAGDGIVRIKDDYNIKVFTNNNILNFNKTNLVLTTTNYENVYNFIKNYTACDKVEFAKQLSGVTTFKDYSDSYTTIEKAYYYFNQLFTKSVA